MTTELSTSIHKLLSAWRDHQDNRTAGASFAELDASRSALDSARNATWANRY